MFCHNITGGQAGQKPVLDTVLHVIGFAMTLGVLAGLLGMIFIRPLA
jgi:hypothetical protein